MKKLLLLLLCVPLIFSCGEKKVEYNFRPLESIKEPCDCIDNITEVFKKGISEMKGDNNYNAANDVYLENQANKIQEYCEDKFRADTSKYRYCDNFYKSEKIFQEFEELSSRRKKDIK